MRSRHSPDPTRVARAARFVAISVVLLVMWGHPVGPTAGSPTEVAPIGGQGTMIVNGFAVPIPRPTNDELVLRPVARIAGEFAPKSVVASGTGLYLAQNMMYRHTISVLDHNKRLVKTIDDSVDLREFGFNASGDVYRGAPVEAAFTSDGSFAFVSNYRMYGPGYDPQAGSDNCGREQGQDSFVYRVDTTALAIDRVYQVGPVPKHLAVTPDDRLLVVSNWCGFDVTVIDLVTHETLAEIDVGRHPRGVAVTSDSRTAYVAVMGSTSIAAIDLSAFSPHNGSTTTGQPAPTYIRGVGITPRHLVLSPDDKTLYVTLNREHAVVAVDLDSGQVIRRARTGRAPRSMDISSDGTALYVVNYESNTMSKIRTGDFAILQEFDTTPRPIGITYDPFNNEVWVSTYSGTIHVYAERPE
ncbi:MAG: YncE family protein [Acidimicrobiia bacterium]|nr:YncE family protein [Acidimicrobiia bacterium]